MPQPIDPNTEFARIAMTERIQQIADRASLVAQNRQTLAAEEALLQRETQVGEPEAKGGEVDTEARRRNPFMGRRRRRERNEDDAEAHTFYNADERPEVLDDDEGRQLDISI